MKQFPMALINLINEMIVLIEKHLIIFHLPKIDPKSNFKFSVDTNFIDIFKILLPQIRPEHISRLDTFSPTASGPREISFLNQDSIFKIFTSQKKLRKIISSME